MPTFPRPRVVVSRCLGFDHCRWNGLTIASDVVEVLKPFVEFQTTCPEVEIGLGVPRKPIRLVGGENEAPRLLQSETEADVSDRMNTFSEQFLDGLQEIDGFILKGRSPSCGLKDVKLYPRLGKVAALNKKQKGFFARAVLARFDHLPVEDEGRLTNFAIREHFLTRLFAVARLRALLREPSMPRLVQFQAEQKLLLMATNQRAMRTLGRIVANHEKHPLPEVVRDYAEEFYRAFAKQPRAVANINVLMHALGHFSEGLSKGEKAYFLETLEKYRGGKLPLSVPISIVRSYIVRFGEPYLEQQTYFAPYPEELMEITDSGKGRSY